jgi:hypothetical protein
MEGGVTATTFLVTKDSYLPDVFTGELELVAREGEIVYRFRGATYGCIDWENGVACSRGGPLENPFFEVPKTHLQPTDRRGA